MKNRINCSARLFILSLLFLSLSTTLFAQDWAKLKRYSKANDTLDKSQVEVVFMGNSITDNWAKMRPEFFAENGFTGRGISGQTTPQMLVRFRQDVVNLSPKVVVILAGTNDIAGNTGPATFDMILDNIASMCDIAKANKIKVVLCSVLPAKQYRWNKEVRPDLLIPEFNKLLRQFAKKRKITYVDYFSAMVDTKDPNNANGLPLIYSTDGVHPTIKGYEIMEQIILKVLK